MIPNKTPKTAEPIGLICRDCGQVSSVEYKPDLSDKVSINHGQRPMVYQGTPYANGAENSAARDKERQNASSG